MSNVTIEHIESLTSDLKNAYDRLCETQEYPATLIHQESALQRFEFTFELSWKTMQAMVRYNGEVSRGPRDTIRVAAQYGLIDDPQLWFTFLDYRNVITHVYRIERAQMVFDSLPQFIELVGNFIEQVHKEMSH